MSDQNTNDTLLDVFVFETSQLMEQLETIILSNEEECCYSQDSINEIFRIMHTIKGSAAMMTFHNISALAHEMEDLFYYIREKKPKKVDCAVLSDLILACIDFLNLELEKIKNSDMPDGENEELTIKIEAFLTQLKKNQETSDISKEKSEEEKKNDVTPPCCAKEDEELEESETLSCFKAVIHFDEGIDMENIHAYSIVHNLTKSQREVYYYPSDIAENVDSAKVIRKEGFQIYIKSEYSYDVLYQLLIQAVFLKKLELTEIENDEYIKYARKSDDNSGQAKSEEKNEAPPPKKKEQIIIPAAVTDLQMISSQPSIISVNVAKLDKLMDLVGELVIAKAMVIQNTDLDGLELNNFHKAARQLTKITDEIQDVVMAVRMVPLAGTFHKMHRIVRDMCKKLDKEARLEIIGEETEVDKNIIEHISDPLMHLVRNAMDHGIEQPQVRSSKGKPSAGTVVLEAKSAGSDVLIMIRDDGKGLNRESILKKARENNLLTKPEEDMTDKEVFGLVLLPGFSTKDSISEFSGRGVGMDVVIKNIEAVGGSVLIDSIQEQGTVITLKIPLTLAIIDGMNIKVGNSHYTVPTISVKEFFRPEGKDIIADPDGNEMIMVRGQCYPIVRLYELYEVKNAKTVYESGIMIMVEQDGKTICLFTDELLGQQQVVVKALPEIVIKTKKIRGLSGCTLLGDGSISLILDIAALV